MEPIPGFAFQGRKSIGRAAPGRAAASVCCMVNAGGSGPVMAVAGQMGRAYHPGPLTLGMRLRSGHDNRGNFTPWAQGQEEANKRPRKRRGRPTKSTYILDGEVLAR
jgi:hypothetical protein